MSVSVCDTDVALKVIDQYRCVFYSRFFMTIYEDLFFLSWVLFLLSIYQTVLKYVDKNYAMTKLTRVKSYGITSILNIIGHPRTHTYPGSSGNDVISVITIPTISHPN